MPTIGYGASERTGMLLGQLVFCGNDSRDDIANTLSQMRRAMAMLEMRYVALLQTDRDDPEPVRPAEPAAPAAARKRRAHRRTNRAAAGNGATPPPASRTDQPLFGDPAPGV